MDELPTAEECLLKAQEYLALAQDTDDATLRSQYTLMAKELMALAGKLDGTANSKAASKTA